MLWLYCVSVSLKSEVFVAEKCNMCLQNKFWSRAVESLSAFGSEGTMTWLLAMIFVSLMSTIESATESVSILMVMELAGCLSCWDEQLKKAGNANAKQAVRAANRLRLSGVV